MRYINVVLILLLSYVTAFAQVTPFVPKQSPALPDAYSVTIKFVNGTSETFELASHRLKDGQFEFETRDDLWNWVPMSSVARIEFDKRFSQIMDIKEKEERKAAEAAKAPIQETTLPVPAVPGMEQK